MVILLQKKKKKKKQGGRMWLIGQTLGAKLYIFPLYFGLKFSKNFQNDPHSNFFKKICISNFTINKFVGYDKKCMRWG